LNGNALATCSLEIKSARMEFLSLSFEFISFVSVFLTDKALLGTLKGTRDDAGRFCSYIFTYLSFLAFVIFLGCTFCAIIPVSF